MQYWPWWLGGLALAGVAVAHWLLIQRMLAVSGRLSAIVDRLRHGPPQEPDMSEQEMVAALREMTAEEFGDEALEAPDAEAAGEGPREPAPARGRASVHVVFLLGLLLGGALSAALAGVLAPSPGLRSPAFDALVGGGVAGPLVLLGGGLLVGFGTRMAAGCTSGHGLCGVSRLQSGSLLATAAFFGTGVGVSFLVGWLA